MIFSLKQSETLSKVQKRLMAMVQMIEKRSGKSATLEKKSAKVSNGGEEVCRSQSQQGKARLVVIRVMRRSGLGRMFFRVIGLQLLGEPKIMENSSESIYSFLYGMEKIEIIFFKRSVVNDKHIAGVGVTNCNAMSRNMKSVILFKWDLFRI